MAFSSQDSPLNADALIHSHDGIAGAWQHPGSPPALAFEDPANLQRSAAWVRAGVFDFELLSRLGFAAAPPSPGTEGQASLLHLHVAADAPGGVPAVEYHPLVQITRPPEAKFRAQAALVNNYADLRPDRASEIMAQMGGAQAFLSSVAYASAERSPWTMELLATAFRLAGFAELRFKHALACRRPIEYSPQIQPMIQTPAHGALPSGHATEAFITSLVLWRLLQASGNTGYGNQLWGLQLMRLAARVAINRQVAGVHTPMESAAGAVLGLTLGEYLVARCTQPDAATPHHGWTFDGPAYPDQGDFEWDSLFKTATGQAETDYAKRLDPAERPLGAPSPILAWLWNKAVAEWQ